MASRLAGAGKARPHAERGTELRYRDAGEIRREGLRLVESREAEDAAKLEALRQAARIGIAAIERGEAHAFAGMDEPTRYLDCLAATAIGEAGSS